MLIRYRPVLHQLDYLAALPCLDPDSFSSQDLLCSTDSYFVMFSCALFEATSSTPLPAEDAEVSVEVIGTVGQGTATCTYRLARDAEGLVLYVPSLLSLTSVTRQHVRVCGCEVTLAKSSAAEKTVVSHPLRLQIDNADDLKHTIKPAFNGSSSEQLALDYDELKGRYKATAAELFGSHSYEDVLLHVGHLPRGAELSVCFEFLTRFSSSNQRPPVQYSLRHSLPSLKCSYKVFLAALSPVTDITTAGTPTTFSWDYIYDSQGHRNLVQLSYTTKRDIGTPGQSTGVLTDTQSLPGVNVHLLGGGTTSAGCCCSLLSGPHTAGPDTNSLPAPYDGVMVMSSVFTPSQLPKSLQLRPYSPSEFVFVVDCSGSMSGSNIQIAADTLITCVKSLPAGAHFNVIAFGSTFRQLFHSSELYSESTMESAVTFANQLQACLGGTELLGPLHWIFKSKRVSGLPCQVFIITDGGVTNTTSVLRCVRRNRHQARCHTFGIGGEVCVELVTGIAAASGGQCVLVSQEDRLQTKVMEVLKDSMQPSMSNVMLQWHPPKGYSVADSSPRNLGTIFSGNSYSSFAFLRCTDPMANEAHESCGIPAGRATLTGLVNGEQVEIEIDPITLPPLSDEHGHRITSLLSHAATWSKLGDLELQALTSSRKNSHNDSNEDQIGVPLAKKPRLNGETTHTTMSQKPLPENPFREELTELSMRSGIPCPLTYFQSESGNIRQIIPPPHSSLMSKPSAKNGHALPPTFKSTAPHRNGTSSHRYRKRKHSHHRPTSSSFSSSSFSSSSYTPSPPSPDISSTLSSLARSTFSAIGSTLKTMASLTTFGLVGQESLSVVENGQSLEDEIELQKTRHSQLHWDERRGNIVYPDIYYRSHPGNYKKHHCNGDSTNHTTSLTNGKRSRRSSKHSNNHNHHHQNDHHTPKLLSLIAPSDPSFPAELRLYQPIPMAQGMEEDDDMAISDTESDSSVDPDWDDLHKPSELLPLIHIQLYNGAWPLLRAFSYAVGVPLEEIRKLPLPSNHHHKPGTNGVTSQGGGEKEANLWATVVALACLEEHFSELRTEWEVVAYKGLCWVEQELEHTKLSITELQRRAKELVQRQSS